MPKLSIPSLDTATSTGRSAAILAGKDARTIIIGGRVERLATKAIGTIEADYRREARREAKAHVDDAIGRPRGKGTTGADRLAFYLAIAGEDEV